MIRLRESYVPPVHITQHVSVLSVLTLYFFSFARHPLYLYLAFDRIVLSEAAIANYLRVKHTSSTRTCERVGTLTLEALEQASIECGAGKTITNPDVNFLLSEIRAIGQHVTCSYGEKVQWRAEIKGLMLDFCPPLFWITVTPSDLNNPIVIKYTDPEEFDSFLDALNVDDYANQAHRHTANPVSIAKFFSDTCQSIFEKLIGANPDDTVGILGPMRAHYGVVESNGRGMLHVHCFVWVDGGYKLPELWETLNNKTQIDNHTKIIQYLESVIKEHIDQPEDTVQNSIFKANFLDSTRINMISELDFKQWAAEIANEFQRHLQTHTPSCRKGGVECRYSFPRELVRVSHVQEAVVRLKRDDPWVNNYNPALAIALMANQDIQAIGSTSSRTLAAMYYMCCYATKDDAKPKDIVAQAVFLRKSIQATKRLSASATEDTNLDILESAKFAMKCHNRIAYTRELPGPMIAYRLLGNSGRITSHDKYESINLGALHRAFIIHVRKPSDSTTNLIDIDDNEECVIGLKNGASRKANAVERYIRRGRSFERLCLYDYIKFVRHESTKGKESIKYDDPPVYLRSFYQRMSSSQDSHKIRLFGTFKPGTYSAASEKCDISDKEDVEYFSALKLSLFVPWGIGLQYFVNLNSNYTEYWQDIFNESHLTSIVKPRHIQYAYNFSLLHRSLKMSKKIRKNEGN